ncbi:hypothetical protein [Microbacterium sp. LWH3-1.2]|uniref:hypothetical protein n=1 Tax=Microbacterium sp. LWH3-1.2 TaxID=3135256 RepID=UPI003429B324
MATLTLLRRDRLLATTTSRRLTASVAGGELTRLRIGVYVDTAAWNAATPEDRAIARAHALALTSPTAPVVSHETAAAAHGLPLYRADRRRVHVIAPHSRPGAAGGVIRHRGELRDDDVVEIDGLRITSLARTISDVARTASFEQAVTVADAALRRQFVAGPHEYDFDGAERFRREVLVIAGRSAHGLTRARRVLEFADGRAQLPGESISRIRLREIGFRVIGLQVAVPGRGIHPYFVDFGLDEANAFGEFDGAIKYVDGKLLDGRTSSQVFDEEKQREDWIRGTTQRSYARWGWPHLATVVDLRTRLEAFSIRPRR